MKNGVTPVNLAGTVKRNLAVLAFTQALITIIVQTFVVHVPVTIILLGGSATLAGLGTAFMWGGRLVTTYQMGRLMDMVGRMPVVMAGMALLAVSAAAAGLSALQHLLVPYLVVLVLFGIGRGMVDNSRIAAGDMLGRVLVTVSGVVVCAVGAYITAVGGSLPLVTPGMFLVGVGWSAATVGSLALISDETVPEERGKALGLNDTSIALASLATPILASAVLEHLGATALGLVGLSSAAPPILLAKTFKSHREN
jgi:MFS family permease